MMKVYRWNAARTRAGSVVAAALVGGGLLLTASNGFAAETTKQVENKVRTVLAPVVPAIAPPDAPEAPAALPRSFIAGLLSVVSMITLTAPLPSSPRIFSTIVRPSMFGMFTSLTTSFTPGFVRSFARPSLPSTAVSTSRPFLRRKPATSSRTVPESSTTRIFAICFSLRAGSGAHYVDA